MVPKRKTFCRNLKFNNMKIKVRHNKIFSRNNKENKLPFPHGHTCNIQLSMFVVMMACCTMAGVAMVTVDLLE